MLFDSHTHVNFKAFDQDREDVLARAKQAGMILLNVGAAYDTSAKAVAVALSHDHCYATVGLHPIHVYDEDFQLKRYQELIDRGKGRVKAVGECGIDYWHIKRTDLPLEEIKEKQRTIFEQQIDLAVANNLALMIHGRNGKDDLIAYKTIYEITQEKKVKRATVHCYGGNLEEARMFTAAGFYIGITGIATFDKNGKLDEIIRAIPLEHLLIETDAPYLAPEPFRGKRNEPPYVVEVAKHIAQVKKIPLEEVVATTTSNAKKLFDIS